MQVYSTNMIGGLAIDALRIEEQDTWRAVRIEKDMLKTQGTMN
jgi:hypothetical protein